MLDLDVLPANLDEIWASVNIKFLLEHIFFFYAEYDAENPKVTTKCVHDFHLACILEWMERSETCPVCDQVWARLKFLIENCSQHFVPCYAILLNELSLSSDAGNNIWPFYWLVRSDFCLTCFIRTLDFQWQQHWCLFHKGIIPVSHCFKLKQIRTKKKEMRAGRKFWERHKRYSWDQRSIFPFSLHLSSTVEISRPNTLIFGKMSFLLTHLSMSFAFYESAWII